MSEPIEIKKRMRSIEKEIARAVDRILRFPTDGQMAYYQGLADEYATLEGRLADFQTKIQEVA